MAAKRAKNTYRYSVPIYGGRLSVVVSDNFLQDMERYRCINSDDASLARAGAFAFEEDSNSWVVFTPKKSLVSIVAHEAVHVANFIFKERGMELDLDNDEGYAYLVGWISEKIVTSIEKDRKKQTTYGKIETTKDITKTDEGMRPSGG
jgi:hypothetical protein